MDIDIPTNWNNKLSRIMEEWKQLSDGEKNELFTMFTKDKKENSLEDFLFWDEELILKYLKKYCVKVEENANMMWYTWRKIYIKLPAIWNFKWFNFDCFASYKAIYKKDFENNPEFKNKSFLEEEIQKLLQAMNEYMREFWVEMGEVIKSWETERTTCDAWEDLKKITGLTGLFWLKDKCLIWKKSLYSCWNCYPADVHIHGFCCFEKNSTNSLQLLLKN